MPVSEFIWTVIPTTRPNRRTGQAKLKLTEMDRR